MGGDVIFSAIGANIPAAALPAACTKSLLITVTFAPWRFNSMAIAKPMMPPPIIRISLDAFILPKPPSL